MFLQETEPLTIGELSGMWLDITSGYSAELSAQTTSEMLVNLADSQVEWPTVQNSESFSDENAEIVKLLLRTRRFNHALATVLAQDEAGRPICADTIVSAIGTLHEVFGRVKTQWMSLKDAAGDDAGERINTLHYGHAGAPEFSGERYGANGIGIGLAANACLLGVCGEPKHLGALLSVAQPGDAMIGYGARFAAIDAMDRIIVRQELNASLAPEAKVVVGEYMAWRAQRKLPARGVAKTFSYDAPGTPYDLAGTVGGLPRKALPDFELPLVPACCTGGHMYLKTGILDTQDAFREYNDYANGLGYSEGVLREDPAVGLTIEDTHYIVRQSQRLAAAVTPK